MTFLPIDPFSLYVLFSLYRSCDNTLKYCFVQILSYSRAYLCIICKKTKGKFPRNLYWENKKYKVNRSIKRLFCIFQSNVCCLISNQEGLGWVCSLWDKQHASDIVRKSTLRLETFFKFGVYWAYVEQDKAIHKKHKCLGSVSFIFISYKFSSFLIAVSCSVLARLTPNLRFFLT